MASVSYRDEEFDRFGAAEGQRGRRRKKKKAVHEGSVPIAKQGSNQFVAQTWRFFFYALFLAAGGASLAFFTPLAFALLPVALVTMLISFFTFLVLHYGFENYSGAFYAFLVFATTLGIVLGPQLVLIAATVQNGMFIICAAAAATAGMTIALSAYAWTKATFSLHRISLLGSFLSTALTGLLIVGLIALIFPTPLVMLLYGAAGVAVFSLYLVYDVYLLKIGAFKSPVEAALNLFLDVLNLFLDILKVFIAIQSEKKEVGDFSNFFLTRIVPLVGIALIVLSFGLLERWIMKDWHGIDEDQLSDDDNAYYQPPPSAASLQPSQSAPVFPQQPPQNPQFGAGHSQSFPQAGHGNGNGTGKPQQTFFGNAASQQASPPPQASAPPLVQDQGQKPQYGFSQYGQSFGGLRSDDSQGVQTWPQYQQSPQGYNPAFTGNMSGQPLYPPVQPYNSYDQPVNAYDSFQPVYVPPVYYPSGAPFNHDHLVGHGGVGHSPYYDPMQHGGISHNQHHM